MGDTVRGARCRENGNPRGPAPELRHRWDALDREADRYAAEATATDCGATIHDFAALRDALEGFQYDVYAFDAVSDLREAESDRRHYLSMRSTMTPELKRAFRVIRHMRHGRELKRASSHVQRMRRSYRVIGNAELHEEYVRRR